MDILLFGMVSVASMMAMMIWMLGTEIDAEKRRLQEDPTSRCSPMYELQDVV